MPVGQVNMLLTIPGEPTPIVGQVNMMLTIPTAPPDGEPPVIPPDWQEWLEENWEVIAAVIVAAVILAIILTRGT